LCDKSRREAILHEHQNSSAYDAHTIDGGKVPEVRHMNEQDSNRKTHRVVPAPPPSNPRLYSTVLSVECAEDEEIEWQWTETPEGRFVSGYRLVLRLATPPST
jgi:hypothetical protein